MLSIYISDRLVSFRRSEVGATAVEFAIVLPVMLACFAAIVEGSRIYWNYQGAVSGVRDATRYLARTTDVAICSGGTNANYLPLNANNEVATATTIIQRNMTTGAAALWPTGVEVTSVTAAYACPDYDLRSDPTPVARVQATINVSIPLAILFTMFMSPDNGVMTSVITDQSRIYGI